MALMCPHGVPAASVTYPFATHCVQLGLVNLYGCTSVVLVSRYGAAISHFWECPSFVGIDDNGDLRSDPYQFFQDVLLTLRCGCQWQQQDSLGTSTYKFFPINFPMFSAPMANTKVVIITPHDVDVNGSWNIRYPLQIAAIQETILEMLPNLSGIDIFGYYSPGNQDPFIRNPEVVNRPLFSWGKILLQYFPGENPFVEVHVGDRLYPVMQYMR